MRREQFPRRSYVFRFNADSGEFVPEIDWEQFDACQTCRGRAELSETPDGDLVCAICRAKLPRPQT